MLPSQLCPLQSNPDHFLSVVPPKKIWGDLPAEIKLLIFSYPEEGQRVIVCKPKFSYDAPPILFLGKPLRPPLLLQICHETRAKALMRFSSTLSEPYENFGIDFKTDIFTIIPICRSLGRLLSKERGLKPIDRKRVMNFSTRAGFNDNPAAHVLRYVLEMVYAFPNSRYVFQNKPLERCCTWAMEDQLRDNYVKN